MPFLVETNRLRGVNGDEWKKTIINGRVDDINEEIGEDFITGISIDSDDKDTRFNFSEGNLKVRGRVKILDSAGEYTGGYMDVIERQKVMRVKLTEGFGLGLLFEKQYPPWGEWSAYMDMKIRHIKKQED
jgi:hypothetical protein